MWQNCLLCLVTFLFFATSLSGNTAFSLIIFMSFISYTQFLNLYHIPQKISNKVNSIALCKVGIIVSNLKIQLLVLFTLPGMVSPKVIVSSYFFESTNSFMYI